ncbi:MAG TPA: enolase C-terminal domain-like protein [Myxococcales bacterium]|jgi:L-alanine-DL-glutamate epimerase-like enolase superfamily enzyme|nr:enolase C-terminal domain-like protein [Myxococcales bacterium]
MIGRLGVSAWEIPVEHPPESDGTAQWSATTLVVCRAGDGLGYTYADTATARLLSDVVAGAVEGLSPFDPRKVFETARAALRNHGWSGASAMALSALDLAVWDWKAKLLGVPISKLLGRVRDRIPAYGSGGLTSYPDAQLEAQLGAWADAGFSAVKMKVGREPSRDVARVQLARKAIGRCALFVDANGAWSVKQALKLARQFESANVSWLEEPVVRSDLAGLRLLRDRCELEIAGGEYAYLPADILALIPVLDVVQADATRCGGITGFLDAHALCSAFEKPMSSHCAPALHVALGCALPAMRHVEWFVDHQRIERLFFDGAPVPERGSLAPSDAPGFGLIFKSKDAERLRR